MVMFFRGALLVGFTGSINAFSPAKTLAETVGLYVFKCVSLSIGEGFRRKWDAGFASSKT